MSIYDTDVKNTIISTARSLFQSQGYEQTTIRQLVSACHITTGTLYKYFDNKVEIFKAVRVEDIERVSNLIKRIITVYRNPLLILSINTFIVFTLVQKYERYAETIQSSHMHTELNEPNIDEFTRFTKTCFTEFVNDYSDEDIRTRVLIINGIFHSIISDYLKGYDSDIISKADLVVRTIYRLYDVPEKTIDSILAQTIVILKEYESDLLNILD